MVVVVVVVVVVVARFSRKTKTIGSFLLKN